ncbi:MAG TPA: DNA methyltransferase [Gaiellales bacterium]|nr:DNA methyltransferase [Gaiellales bacterium]
MPTQQALYADLTERSFDPELSWAEHELPERLRTKHVHRLHPYLGKFVPQLVERFLDRHFRPGQRILDPFAGSGTTLVECTTFGANSVGVDVSAFNVLLSTVKTGRYDADAVERDLVSVLQAAEEETSEPGGVPPGEYLRTWYHPDALDQLLRYRTAVCGGAEHVDLARVVLSRAARSARLTTHFELDFPRAPQTGPYQCRKHSRVCTPTADAAKFLRRYTLDTIRRVREYAALRADVRAEVLHADARCADYGVRLDGLVTSPPYPGRIDYHEQHRYAFELLGLDERRADEIGAPWRGTGRAAIDAYVADMTAVFANARRFLAPGAPVVLVVDDSRELFGTILGGAGLQIREQRLRHVNRRTGRRAGEFYEQVILAAA